VYKTGRTPAHLDRWLARNSEAPVWSAHVYTNSCSGAELRIPIEPLVRVDTTYPTRDSEPLSQPICT